MDRTTEGYEVEPEEVQAVLHNLCGYHLAEPDPLFRYTVLTREQVLYDALVAAIKRERGRALAELASGRTLKQVAEIANVGSRQRVQRLIALAKAAEDAAAAVQAASLAFEDQLAAVEVPVAVAELVSVDEVRSVDRATTDDIPVVPGIEIARSPLLVEPDAPASVVDPVDPGVLLEPTLPMPTLAPIPRTTGELQAHDDDELAWWRQRDTGAA
jgi:hypothetical protein